MTEDPNALQLRCRCGRVRGVANEVAPNSGFRFVCYCQDCQAFARFLERPDVLDTEGGTDIFHIPAGRVKLTTGTDAVRCLHFSSKIFRWYTDCCRTPIGNTAGPRFGTFRTSRDVRSSRALARSLSIIAAQTRFAFVARENRC